MNNKNNYYILNLPSNYYSPEDLKNILRLLSTQNTMWTRSYIVSDISNIGDLIVLENRIYVNVIDFKNIFNIYYSDEISARYEELFRDYTNKLSQTLTALKATYNIPNASSQEDLLQAKENWNASGIEFANFLSEINPYWKLQNFEKLILDHIDMTIGQMNQRLMEEYAYEVHQYDFIEYHSLMIADILHEGIIEMFY